MDVRFVASVSPIVRSSAAARDFYSTGLGITFEGSAGDYLFTERLRGVKHFGLWPLAEAAQACFGTPHWPADVPAPQASIEFEVDDVPGATAELQQRGLRLLHGPRTEPWKQETARLLTPEGLLVAVCRTPWLHPDDSDKETPAREAFWDALDAAGPVLASPELHARWAAPSALDEMTVGDLAAHLTRAVTNVVTYLSRPPAAGPPISPSRYFIEVLGSTDDLGDVHSPANQGVRARSREDAEAGPDELLRRWHEARQAVRDKLAEEPADRLVTVAAGLVLTVDDYLATRVVELLVHTDDLAVSLDLALPQPPDPAAELAERVLLGVARIRHGDTDVLRALTRRERRPTTLLRAL